MPKMTITVGPLTLLTLLFVVLKLTGVLECGWVWVLIPTWLPIAFLLMVVFLIAALQGVVFISTILAARVLPKKRRERVK